MKGAARLTLFYLVTFVFFLGTSVLFSVVRAWAGTASVLAPHPFSPLAVGISAFSVVAPFAVYAAVLSSFSYSARHAIGSVLSTLLIFLLSSAALFSGAYGGLRASAYAPKETTMAPNGSPAAIVRFENGGVVALVGRAAVVAVPPAPLRMASAAEGPEYGLRSARVDPFAPSLAVSPALGSLSAAFSAAGRRLAGAAAAGEVPLLAYAAALSFLLASLRFLAGSTRWPLADFVLCAVALRGVAALDEFLSSAVVRRLISSIAGLPETYAVPAALASVGAAITICAGLARIARGRREVHVR